MRKQQSLTILLSSLILTLAMIIIGIFYSPRPVNAFYFQSSPTSEAGLYLPIVVRSADTSTSTPTSTNTPTSTSTPTNTPTNTSTPIDTPTDTATPTDTPTNTPTTPPPFTLDGVWEGTTRQGRPITFTIASRGFTRFTTAYKVGGCGALQTTFFQTPQPITGNTFVVTQIGGIEQVRTVTNGAFSADKCASGDMQVTGTQCGSLTTTWTAVKQGSDGSTCPFTPTPTPGSNDTGRVTFVSGRDGNSEIYVMNANGSVPTRLTNNTATDFNPRWSPDGTKIVFYSNRDGNDEIYVMNADGSGQTRLTTDSHDDRYPTWSPDGQQIVFSTDRVGVLLQIWVMQANGNGQKMLTPTGNTSIEPDWSPDSTKIVYAHYTGRSWDIYQINADGSGETDLSKIDFINETSPKWSPSGSKIVFSWAPPGFVSQVYVMNADGSNMQRLTTGEANYDPTWSPDGTRIMFTSDHDGNPELYVMNADGSGQTRLTDNPASDFEPDWTP